MTMRRLCCAFLPLFILFLNIVVSHGFIPKVWRTEINAQLTEESSLMMLALKNDEHENDKANASDDELDDWLDKPFFDPMAFEDHDDSTWQARLANFVKADYDLFEFIYAGTFLAFMLIVSQELFRMQLYGAEYVPFTSNSHTVNVLWKSM